MTKSVCREEGRGNRFKRRAIRQGRRLRQRLKDTHGITLGEMMVSVLIMSLLTLAVSAGVGTAAKVYRSEKEYSESRVLSNSVFLSMTEELRYASELEILEDGSSVQYDSAVYGAGTVMEIQMQDGGWGKLALVYDEDQTAYPLEDKAYMEYQIMEQEDRPLFLLGEDGTYMELSYDICDANGNVKASLEGVRIRLLNH